MPESKLFQQRRWIKGEGTLCHVVLAGNQYRFFP
jgi:hypothetical protein